MSVAPPRCPRGAPSPKGARCGLRSVERSSDQVVRPVNLDALDKWVGQLPQDVRADMSELAPMLSVLGYDPWANPPDYRAMLEERAPKPSPHIPP